MNHRREPLFASPRSFLTLFLCIALSPQHALSAAGSEAPVSTPEPELVPLRIATKHADWYSDTVRIPEEALTDIPAGTPGAGKLKTARIEQATAPLHERLRRQARVTIENFSDKLLMKAESDEAKERRSNAIQARTDALEALEDLPAHRVFIDPAQQHTKALEGVAKKIIDGYKSEADTATAYLKEFAKEDKLFLEQNKLPLSENISQHETPEEIASYAQKDKTRELVDTLIPETSWQSSDYDWTAQEVRKAAFKSNDWMIDGTRRDAPQTAVEALEAMLEKTNKKLAENQKSLDELKSQYSAESSDPWWDDTFSAKEVKKLTDLKQKLEAAQATFEKIDADTTALGQKYAAILDRMKASPFGGPNGAQHTINKLKKWQERLKYFTDQRVSLSTVNADGSVERLTPGIITYNTAKTDPLHITTLLAQIAAWQKLLSFYKEQKIDQIITHITTPLAESKIEGGAEARVTHLIFSERERIFSQLPTWWIPPVTLAPTVGAYTATLLAERRLSELYPTTLQAQRRNLASARLGENPHLLRDAAFVKKHDLVNAGIFPLSHYHIISGLLYGPATVEAIKDLIAAAGNNPETFPISVPYQLIKQSLSISLSLIGAAIRSIKKAFYEKFLASDDDEVQREIITEHITPQTSGPIWSGVKATSKIIGLSALIWIATQLPRYFPEYAVSLLSSSESKQSVMQSVASSGLEALLTFFFLDQEYSDAWKNLTYESAQKIVEKLKLYETARSKAQIAAALAELRAEVSAALTASQPGFLKLATDQIALVPALKESAGKIQKAVSGMAFLFKAQMKARIMLKMVGTVVPGVR